MNDLFDILSLLCTLSLPAGLALFIRWVFSFIKKPSLVHGVRNKKRCWYIESFSVLLSFAIAFLAAILIFTPWRSIVAAFVLSDYLYYIGLFFAGFVIVLFFRVLAPIAISLYLLYLIVFAVLFMHSYSLSPKSFDIQISEPSSITAHSVTLSVKNLLPLPRYWISEPVIEDTSVTENLSAELSVFAPSIELFKENSIFASIIKSLSSLVIGTNNIQHLTLPLDASGEAAMQYTVEFSAGKNGLVAEVF